ncbi:hypothetical protein [Brevundimonas lenta]|uniref:Uncharacterized protein n=1 Tax=Brevundimonas lenta TaxID=424796 RepID=A0A7W6JDZ5_9CAUL|nr:hypothetical protein [Brevundimonas lenta]MBB4083380.1 hypothetical protein [Brevundimonas lenta]
MSDRPDQQAIAISSGSGMVAGAALGFILTPLTGSIGLVLGAGAGLVIGAAIPLLFKSSR